MESQFKNFSEVINSVKGIDKKDIYQKIENIDKSLNVNIEKMKQNIN